MAQVMVKMAYSNTFAMDLKDACKLIELVNGKRVEYVSSGLYKRCKDSISIETEMPRIYTQEDTNDTSEA